MSEHAAAAVIVGAEKACGLGLVRSLAQADIPIVVADIDTLQPAMHSRFARGVELSSLKGKSLVDDLMRIAEPMKVPAVLFLTTDDIVRTVSEHRDVLGQVYRFELPEHDRLMALMQKTYFHQFAESHGFPVPRTVTIKDPADLEQLSALDFPCIVKPSIKASEYLNYRFERGYRLATRSEADAICRRLLPVARSLVVQEWIEGPDSALYFCLQYRASDGTTVCSFTGRKLSIWPPDVGVTASCTAAPEAQPVLQSLTEAFFQAASFVGMGSMEFKRDARTGRYAMIEPTLGRADWQEEVATLHGANIPLAAYRGAVGLPSLAQPPLGKPVVWRGSWTNTRFPSKQTGAWTLKTFDAYWRRNDPLPAAYYAGIMARTWLGRVFCWARDMHGL